MQAYAALLHAAVKCGETDLAIDVYSQMGREGMPRDCAIYITMVEMFVKVGTAWQSRSTLVLVKCCTKDAQFNTAVAPCISGLPRVAPDPPALAVMSAAA